MNAPQRSAGQVVNDLLQGPSRRGEPMSIDYADIAMRAAHAHDRLVEAGARQMVAERWRITAAIYPFIPKCWPVEFKDATDVLADCCRMIAGEQGRGRAGHWSFDMHRLIALEQARDALLIIITAD